MTEMIPLGSGVTAASPEDLIAALQGLPPGATLFKLWVTGNLAVLTEDEGQVGVVDLVTGEFDDWR